MVGKIDKNICKVCKREFKLKDSLNHHLEKHHGYEAVSYKCSHCFKRFKWSANLEKHLKEAHTNLERFECGICASTYKYEYHLKQHMDMKHNPHTKPNKCPDCGVLIERRELFLRHMKFHHPKVVVPVQCKSCPMVFVSRSKLRHHHLKIHANHGRTKCPHCSSTFKWRGHLSGHIKKQHMTNIHVDESVINKELENTRYRTNRCRHCCAIFKLKFDLLVHYRRSHDENISIFRCCQCEAVFVIKTSLERHIVKYHKEKNTGEHRCEQCFPDINVKPISVKVEHGDDNRDDMTNENFHEGNHSDTNVAKDVQGEASTYFEQTISDHPDLRDMILMKSQISDVVLSTDNTVLNFNGEKRKSPQTVEFEVPLLNPEMEDKAKIANTNRDASTQVNFYEDMFCNKNNLPIFLYSTLDGNLWQSLSKTESTLRKDSLSDVSQIARKKKVRSIKTDSRRSQVRYRCEECDICFNMSYSLDDHIQTEHGSETVNVINEKGDEIEDNTPQDTFINTEHSAEKENSLNTVAVVNKVLQVHLQKIDMNLLKNKVLVSDDSKLNPSPIGLYDCKHCGATFKYKRHFFRHAYQKHGLRFNCSKCDLKFDTRIQSMKHLRTVHLHEDKIVTKACVPSLENTKDIANDSEQQNQDVQLHFNNKSNKESGESCVQTIFHKCDLCDRKYKMFSQLRRHITLKHQKVQSFKCKYCPKLFKNNVLRHRHILKTHSQLNKFVCKICNLKFKQDILLKSHYNLEHTKNETQRNNSTLHVEYMCKTSDKTFKRKDTVIDTDHSDGTSKQDRHAEDPSYSDKVVRCNLCNETFKLKIQLLQHKKEVHSQNSKNFSCNMCKSIFKSKRALKTHYSLKHSDYYCYDCDLSFRTDSLLQRHIEVSHATLVNSDLSSGHMDILAEHTLTLSCIKCNLTFKNETQLDDHIQSLHINASIDNDTMTTSNCKKCNLNFNTESEMNEHIIEMHPTKKVTFRCSVCHARFNIRDNLLQHIDIEHRHKCGVCQIKFKIKDELLQHMATKHSLSVRLYNCEKCPMTFRLADSLKRHLHETHSEIKVAQSTKTASAIQEQCMPHIMMNKCKYCDALFPRKDSLERHIQWEHPTCVSLHKCGQCASVFSDIEDLKEHLRMEHFADIIVYKATASKSNA